MELENKNDIQRLDNEHYKLRIEEKLVEDLQNKYNKYEEKILSKDKEGIIKLRIKQYGLANIMVNLYNLDKNFLILSLYKLADSYYKFDCFNQSEEYLIKALNLNEENQNCEFYFKNEIIILKNLSLTYKKLKYYDEAFKFCEQLILLYKKLDNYKNDDEYYNILIWFGNLNRLLKKNEYAEEIYSKVYDYLNNCEEKTNINMKIKLLYFEFKNYNKKKNHKAIDKVDELISLIEDNCKISKKKKYFDLLLEKISLLSKLKSKEEMMEELIKKIGMKLKDELFELNGRFNIENIKYLKQVFIFFSQNKFFNEALIIINLIEETLVKKFGENDKKLINTYKEKSLIYSYLKDKDKAIRYQKKSKELEIIYLVKNKKN